MERGTLGELFETKCSIFEERPAVYFRKTQGIAEISYRRYRRLCRAVARGLQKRGLKPGARVGILAGSTLDRCIAFFSVQLCGAVDVGFDETLADEKTAGILKKTGCKFCLIADESRAQRLERLLPVGFVIILLRWKASASGRFLTLSDLGDFTGGQLPDPGPVEGYRKRLFDDPASIVFKRVDLRSPDPRAVVLTHRNIVRNLAGVHTAIPSTENETMLLTPPLWHAMGRFGVLFSLWNGASVLLSREDRFQIDLVEFRPSMVIAPPEHFVNLHDSLMEGDGRDSTRRIVFRKAYFYLAALFNWSIRVLGGQRLLFRTMNQGSDPLRMIAALGLVICIAPFKFLGDFTLGAEARRRLGGRLRALVTGGSSLPFALDQFFQSLNVAVLEGYWMTESAHMAACRMLQFTGQRARLTPRTVGPVLPGLELKLINHRDEDVSHIPGNAGTLYIRGDSVMQGYFQEPAGTAEVLDENGWLCLGDRGRLTINGELQILGRQGRPRDFRIE